MCQSNTGHSLAVWFGMAEVRKEPCQNLRVLHHQPKEKAPLSGVRTSKPGMSAGVSEPPGSKDIRQICCSQREHLHRCVGRTEKIRRCSDIGARRCLVNDWITSVGVTSGDCFMAQPHLDQGNKPALPAACHVWWHELMSTTVHAGLLLGCDGPGGMDSSAPRHGPRTCHHLLQGEDNNSLQAE